MKLIEPCINVGCTLNCNKLGVESASNVNKFHIRDFAYFVELKFGFIYYFSFYKHASFFVLTSTHTKCQFLFHH